MPALLPVNWVPEKIRRRMYGNRDSVRLREGASITFALPNRKEFTGKLKGGSPLENTGKIITDRAKVITDGPFPESKE